MIGKMTDLDKMQAMSEAKGAIPEPMGPFSIHQETMRSELKLFARADKMHKNTPLF